MDTLLQAILQAAVGCDIQEVLLLPKKVRPCKDVVSRPADQLAKVFETISFTEPGRFNRYSRTTL
jgi:hypothetical protein